MKAGSFWNYFSPICKCGLVLQGAGWLEGGRLPLLNTYYTGVIPCFFVESPHIPMKQMTLYPDLISPFPLLTQPYWFSCCFPTHRAYPQFSAFTLAGPSAWDTVPPESPLVCPGTSFKFCSNVTFSKELIQTTLFKNHSTFPLSLIISILLFTALLAN